MIVVWYTPKKQESLLKIRKMSEVYRQKKTREFTKNKMSEVYTSEKRKEISRKWTCPCDRCVDWRDLQRRNGITQRNEGNDGMEGKKVYYNNNNTQTSLFDESDTPSDSSISGSGEEVSEIEGDLSLIVDDIKHVKVVKTEIRRGARGPAGMDGLDGKDGKDGECFHVNIRHLHFADNGNDNKYYFYSHLDEKITSIVVVGSKSGYTNLIVKNNKETIYDRPLLNGVDENGELGDISYYLHKRNIETSGGIIEVSLHTNKKEKKKIYSLGVTLSRRDDTGTIDPDIMMSLGSSISEDISNRKKDTQNSTTGPGNKKDKLVPKSEGKTPLSNNNDIQEEKEPSSVSSTEKDDLESSDEKSGSEVVFENKRVKDERKDSKTSKQVTDLEGKDQVKVLHDKERKSKFTTDILTKNSLPEEHNRKTEISKSLENKSEEKVGGQPSPEKGVNTTNAKNTTSINTKNNKKESKNVSTKEGNDSKSVKKIEKEDNTKGNKKYTEKETQTDDSETPSEENNTSTLLGEKEDTDKNVVKKESTNVPFTDGTQKENSTKIETTKVKNKERQSGTISGENNNLGQNVVKKEIDGGSDVNDGGDPEESQKEDKESSSDVDIENKKVNSKETTTDSGKKEETVKEGSKTTKKVVKKESIGTRSRTRRSRRKKVKIDF